MYTMKESVAVAKEADAKKWVSPTKSDKSIRRVRNEPERQLGSLRGVIGNIRRNGGKPSVESIATELSGMPSAQRAPALLALQQTHGNRYVQRVVSGIPAKLVVGQPGDIYEQEADRVAEQVIRMPEPGVPRQVEEVEEEEEELQAKELSGQTSEISPNLEARINTIRGGGQPLPTSTRAFFEPRFGYDFSQVRAHTDAEADTLNRVLNARAFTTGQDIFFRHVAYNHGSSSGRKLLAHELTHLIQQGAKTDSINVQTNRLAPMSKTHIGIAREVFDAGVPEPRDAGLPGGVPDDPQSEQQPEQQERQEENQPERITPQTGPQTGQMPVCTTRYQRATSFQSLIDLVRAAETRLNASGITSTREQIHALRGIYYGTTWSQDYAVERSTTRNEGFQRFTRPSQDPSHSVPRDVQPLLDCGLFEALRSSQDITDGNRHVDFGHLIIGLDARYDPVLPVGAFPPQVRMHNRFSREPITAAPSISKVISPVSSSQPPGDRQRRRHRPLRQAGAGFPMLCRTTFCQVRPALLGPVAPPRS
jgi:hypothetical protein